MVNDHALILPLLATAFIAMGISKIFCDQPIYQALATPFRNSPAPTASPASVVA